MFFLDGRSSTYRMGDIPHEVRARDRMNAALPPRVQFRARAVHCRRWLMNPRYLSIHRTKALESIVNVWTSEQPALAPRRIARGCFRFFT